MNAKIEDLKKYTDRYPIIEPMNKENEIDKRHLRLIPLMKEISRLSHLKTPVIIGMDGKSASGKTTAGNLLAEILEAEVIHTDDFFLPMNMRTQERLSEPGGNIHYERLKEEVIDVIKKGQKTVYRIFDCHDMDYTRTVEILPNKIYIIEGAYSLHPYFGPIYDLKVFFNISTENQKTQILLRNGREKLSDFEKRWIPMENRYFEYHDTMQNCDMVIDWEIF